jgi:hypothetical protein
MEQLIKKKRRKFNLPTYILFIDYEKAFNRQPRGKLWNGNEEQRLADHTIKTVQSLYINTRIKTDKETYMGNKQIYIN